ncbi:MAG: ORF6N domain-containing protein [Candidatus Symbiothrix sp.]|jgi:hypothetical protein|nr:ORF6N domain-containing protein [Candidatus Symbiothrix sp.]
MNEIVKFNQVEDKILNLRNQSVILDSDVAVLYGVETKRVNEAVKNNPEKFPEGFLWSVSADEKTELVEIFDRFNPLKHSTVLPTAFTEKGLYMLATILKSPIATETTLEIINTFAKLKELSRTIVECSQLPDEQERKGRLQRSGEILSDLIGNELETTGTETSFELNLAILALKHTVKKGVKKE